MGNLTFITENKMFLSKRISNSKLSAMTEEELALLVVEIKAHPEYSEDLPTIGSTPVQVTAGEVGLPFNIFNKAITNSKGETVELPVMTGTFLRATAKVDKNGVMRERLNFQVGNAYTSINFDKEGILRKALALGLFKEGAEFTFNASNIESRLVGGTTYIDNVGILYADTPALAKVQALIAMQTIASITLSPEAKQEAIKSEAEAYRSAQAKAEAELIKALGL